MPTYDALVRTVRDRLLVPYNWARNNGYGYTMTNGAPGARIMNGEFNWPVWQTGTSRTNWENLQNYMFYKMRQLGFEATPWSSGFFNASYNKVQHYSTGGFATTMNARSPGAILADGQPGWHRVRGTNMAGHEFGDGQFDRNPFPPAGSWNYLGQVGCRFVRLPFKWGAIQPTLGGALSTNTTHGVPALINALNAAQANNIQVFLDCHTYMCHPAATSGGARPSWAVTATPAQLSDLWVRLAQTNNVGNHPALRGFDLMNEPHSGTTTQANWWAAAQRCIDDLRAAGFTKRIYWSTWNWGHPEALPSGSSIPRDTSPHALQTWMTIHTYMNVKEGFNSGYADPTYSGQLAAASGSGFTEDWVANPPNPANDDQPWSTGTVEPPPTEGPKFSTFVHGFEGTSVASDIWTTIGTVSISSNRLVLRNDPGDGSAVTSRTAHSLIGSSVFIDTQTPMPAGANNSNEAHMELVGGSVGQNIIRMVKSGNNLFLQVSTNGGTTWSFSNDMPFDATNHRYWRMRNASGTTVIFETSPNGTSWSSGSGRGGSTTTSIPLGALQLRLRGWRYGTESLATWTIERVNDAQVGVPAPSTAPTVSILEEGDGFVRIGWTTVSGATSYVRGYRSVGSANFLAQDVGNVLTATISGLTNGTTYEFRVRGRNEGGDGPNSTIVTATPQAPVVIPKAHELVEDFEALTDKWVLGVGARFEDDRGVTPLTTDQTNWIRSAQAYDLTSSYLFIRPTPATGAGLVTLFQAWINDSNWVSITWEGSEVRAESRVNGTLSTIGSPISYHPNTMVWFRIHEADGVAFFSHSLDAQNWVVFASTANPISLEAVHARMQAYAVA